jgi:hypothetical protein
MKNSHLDLLDDIIGALGPEIVETAFTKLERLGSGEHATVFSCPQRSDLVVRISDYPDGWFSYAYELYLSGEDIIYGPRMRAMRHIEGVWIALADRIEELTFSLETYALVNRARRIIQSQHDGQPSEKDIRIMEAEHPGFCDFAAEHLIGARDLLDENFMWSNGALVVNDPYGSMTHLGEENLIEEFSLSVSQAA